MSFVEIGLIVDRAEKLLFIALLPPEEIQQYVNGIKQHFAEVYDSRAAQKSPPHITLQPPFKLHLEQLPFLEAKLEQFAPNQFPITLTLSGFSAFKPRVIYINVLRTPQLLALHKELTTYLEKSLNIVDRSSQTRPFAPHLTVASRDLTKQNFRKAWVEFESQHVHFEFIVPKLTLLIHDRKRWQIGKEFPFGKV